VQFCIALILGRLRYGEKIFNPGLWHVCNILCMKESFRKYVNSVCYMK